MMLDFTPQRSKPEEKKDMSERINDVLDKAIAEKDRKDYEAGRGSGTGDVAYKRLGSGYIGMECDRALAFKFHKYKPDDDAELRSSVSKGELVRHAGAGHWTEDATAEYMRTAGFELSTERGDGRQHGFRAGWSNDKQQYRIAGEVDGLIHAFPDNVPVPEDLQYPVIWESKKATDKKFNKFTKNGVRKADPVYFGQLQFNMAYMEITYTLFSMLNLNTMRYYWELVPYDPTMAQKLADRAARMLRSNDPFEFPRVTNDPDDFRCGFCDFKDQCWAAQDEAPQGMEKPSWWSE